MRGKGEDENKKRLGVIVSLKEGQTEVGTKVNDQTTPLNRIRNLGRKVDIHGTLGLLVE